MVVVTLGGQQIYSEEESVMKHLYITILVGFVALTLGAMNAQATCACACIEGVERAVCDDISEASSGDNICLDTPMQGQCPAPVGSIDPTVTEPIPSGAENCIHARLYDPATRGYSREVNVCEVAG